jgi:hypothetical protein
MRIAITDACIFIDLHDLDLTISFFSLELEVHTSLDVFNELYPEQQQLLNAFTSVDKLKVHNLGDDDRNEIMGTKYPRALSEVDKTVLHLAVKHDAIVLSSDRSVRNYVKSQAIDYHGIIWIFDQFIEQKILTTEEARNKLLELIKLNLIYQNNTKLIKEFKKRLDKWNGKS